EAEGDGLRAGVRWGGPGPEEGEQHGEDGEEGPAAGLRSNHGQCSGGVGGAVEGACVRAGEGNEEGRRRLLSSRSQTVLPRARARRAPRWARQAVATKTATPGASRGVRRARAASVLGDAPEPRTAGAPGSRASRRLPVI